MKEQLLVLRGMLDEMIREGASRKEINELIKLIQQMQFVVEEHEKSSKETCSLCGKELHGIVIVSGRGLCKDCLEHMEAQDKKERAMLKRKPLFIKVAPNEVKVGDELITPVFKFKEVTKVETYPNSDMVTIKGITYDDMLETDCFISEDVLYVKNTFKRVLL